MEITFVQFMALARAAHAWDIIECWDENAFNDYVNEFGPMTAARAKELCRFIKAVTNEEIIAAKFFGEGV